MSASKFGAKFISGFGQQRVGVIREHLAYINELELQEAAKLEVIAARNTLAMGDFKDREKAFKSLTPSMQELQRNQAKKKMSVRYAKKFAELFKAGKVPDWVIEICDFETIQLLSE